MRIIIDARSVLDRQPSGVSTYTRNMIHAFCKNFPQHTFVLFSNAYAPRANSLEEFKSYPNCVIKQTRIPNKLLHLLFVLTKRPLLSTFTGDGDLYFFPNLTFLPSLPRPSVLTIHDLSFLKRPSYYSFRARAWHASVRGRFLAMQADHVVADSTATQLDILHATKRTVNDVSVVHLALPEYPELPRPEPPQHLCVIGNIEERKNLFAILSALRKAQNIHAQKRIPLVCIGKRGYLSRETKQAIREAIRDGILQEAGYLDDRKKMQLLAKSYALLFPSLHEGFGFPGLEAQAMGVPIVASSKSSLPEILGQGPLYVDPHNVSMIAEAIRIVTGKAPERVPVTYANSLLERSWSDVANNMMNIFTQVTQQYAHRN